MLSIAATSLPAFTAPLLPHATRVAAPVMKAEGEIGVTPPLGVWDPLGCLAEPVDYPRRDYRRYVELEIKHGRIAMLAFLGHAAAAGAHLPGKLAGDLAFADMPKTGFAALAATPPLGLLQMFLFVGFLELKVCKDVTGTGEFPGDFRNGVDNGAWDSFTPQQKLEKRSKELNNGRAAMMGILGLMVHENLAGPAYVANEYFGLPAPF
mmetsp:Transcript_31690/g.104864  ORF Transcript_31690/g.104864 Transcript_31690/m.104864 type:complete len:208 (-) Transcript_31690:274-897(-)